MLVTGIKSKPVYAPLQPDIRGHYHLMVGSGVGAGPLLRILAEMGSVAPHALKATRVLYVPDAEAANGAAPFTVAEVRSFHDAAALLEAFRVLLGESLMGTRL